MLTRNSLAQLSLMPISGMCRLMDRLVGRSNRFFEHPLERPIGRRVANVLFEEVGGHPGGAFAALVAAHAVGNDEELSFGTLNPTEPILILASRAFLRRHSDLDLQAGRIRWHVLRATIDVLDINDPERVELRQTLMDEGEWPED